MCNCVFVHLPSFPFHSIFFFILSLYSHRIDCEANVDVASSSWFDCSNSLSRQVCVCVCIYLEKETNKGKIIGSISIYDSTILYIYLTNGTQKKNLEKVSFILARHDDDDAMKAHAVNGRRDEWRKSCLKTFSI